jgi:hypothetical protein
MQLLVLDLAQDGVHHDQQTNCWLAAFSTHTHDQRTG